MSRERRDKPYYSRGEGLGETSKVGNVKPRKNFHFGRVAPLKKKEVSEYHLPGGEAKGRSHKNNLEAVGGSPSKVPGGGS